MDTFILMVQIVIIKVTMFFMQVILTVLVGCGLLRLIDWCTSFGDNPTSYYDSFCGLLQYFRDYSHRNQDCGCEEEATETTEEAK